MQTKILKKVFGYNHFRPLQSEIITNVLNKKDTLVIMPTGGGKSLCYQIPALIFEGLTIVVSPLISLMKDQVEQLIELGVDAAYLNSSLSREAYNSIIEQVKNNRLKLLYLAPEALLKTNLLDMLSSIKVASLTIDEAHCISEWGHDFRPEYRQLAAVKSRFSGAVCVALTATATPRVQEDIKTSLNFASSDAYIDSFDRKNLFIRIVPKSNPLQQTISFLKAYPDQSGIIYCFSRRQVEDLYDILDREGFSVKPYHAGLSDQDRKNNQELFIKDDIRIITATIAFGMGINKPNVRFVIHYDLPKNIESYYQEIGRAGRDGLRSECLLLFSYADIQKIKYFINQKNAHEKRIASIHLQALVTFAQAEICRRIPLLAHFGETYGKDHCGMCDNCLEDEKEMTDITVYALKFLSCVKRTNEMFGATHIIDVLRGSEAKKVYKFGHQNLPTYGIGKNLSKRQWFQLSRQFLQKGLLKQDQEYGGLMLTPKAWPVLKGDGAVSGRLEEDITTLKQRPSEDMPEHDAKLFENLRTKRKELADASGVPPYVIFSDKTLMEISAYFPQSLESLGNIYGIGEEKLKKYGSLFLEIICGYCEKHQIEERPVTHRRIKHKASRLIHKPRYIEVGEAYHSGRSIDQLMEDYSVKPETILDHLYKYCREGNQIRPDGLLTLSAAIETQQSAIFKSFDKLGFEFLKPVYTEHNGEISYEDLKILRLYYLSGLNT